MLAAALAASTDARAGTEGVPSAQGDALSQMALDALSRGVVAPGGWEKRAALIGLGVAGLYLGASTAPRASGRPRNALRSAAYRLTLPLAGTEIDLAPVVALAPGSYSFGIVGRF